MHWEYRWWKMSDILGVAEAGCDASRILLLLSVLFVFEIFCKKKVKKKILNFNVALILVKFICFHFLLVFKNCYSRPKERKERKKKVIVIIFNF